MSRSVECFLLEPVVGSDRLWRGPDGRIYHLGFDVGDDGVPPAPVGAMWDATWMDYPPGPDGKRLVVRCHHVDDAYGGYFLDWLPDHPSLKWNRTGGVPKITATPSILFVGHYHGWLRDGRLEEC